MSGAGAPKPKLKDEPESKLEHEPWEKPVTYATALKSEAKDEPTQQKG
jgi:hypothetical protein